MNAKSPHFGGLGARQVSTFKPLQPEKALLPMLVTELGMVIDVKPLQAAKAPLPMIVTDSGIVTDVKLLQPKKAK